MSERGTHNGRSGKKGANNSSRARYLKQRAISNSLITGPGMFFTCPRGKEAASVYEFRDLLERVAEEIHPNVVTDEDPVNHLNESEDGQVETDKTLDLKEPESIEDQIQRELLELTPGQSRTTPKQASNQHRFQSKNMECECLGFISFPKTFDPVTFATHIVEEIKQGRTGYGLRFIQRITPVSMTCSASSPDEFEKMVTRALTPRFGIKCSPASNEPDGQAASLATPRVGLKFRIEPIIRCHDKPLNRAEVIRITGDVVQRFNSDEYVVMPDECSVGHDISQVQHRVSIDHAEVVILISVYRYVAAISVVDGYDKEGKRFNLRLLAETHEKKMDVS